MPDFIFYHQQHYDLTFNNTDGNDSMSKGINESTKGPNA